MAWVVWRGAGWMSRDGRVSVKAVPPVQGRPEQGCDLTSARLLGSRRQLLLLAFSLKTMCDFAERRE